MIPVSKPCIPPYEDLEPYLKRIYNSKIVTNNGPLVQELEKKLKDLFNVKHLWIVGNGTIGLQIAVKALGLSNAEIITSPFSYVAAPSAIVEGNCACKFVDINPDTFCIDENQIDKHITSKTKAILPTHVFNTACDVEKIQEIATKHNLQVIYDAAHSFGLEYNGNSIFNYGDIAVCSLHAYKFFSSVEGGFVATNNDSLAEKLYELRYFGVARDNSAFNRIGFNAKNTEFHAAVGLANLKNLDKIKAKRKNVYEYYQKELASLPVKWQKINEKVNTNYSYLTLQFEDEAKVLEIQNHLKTKLIGTRRYFYPSLNQLEFFGDTAEMKVSENLAKTVLSFPLNFDISFEEVDIVIRAIKDCFN